MSNRLARFGEQTFSDVLSFMREMQSMGYDQEFPNSLVLRVLWQNHDHLWARQGKKKGTYVVEARQKASLLHTHVLEVILRDTQTNHEEYLELFDRNGALAVATNVITAKVNVDDKPVPVKIQALLKPAEKSLPWDETLTAIKNNPRFNVIGVRSFEAVAKALKPADAFQVTHHIRLTEKANGVLANYMVAGKSIQQVFFQYNQ